MPVRERRILQENQEQMYASKLPPNPKKRIKTSLHQFLNSLARVSISAVIAAVVTFVFYKIALDAAEKFLTEAER